MSMPRGATPRSAIILISLACLAGVLGAALYTVGYLSHDSAMRQPGLLAILVGAFLAARASVVRARARRAQPVGGGAVPTVPRRPNRVMLIVGAAAVLLGLSLFALGPFSWGIRLFGLVVAMAGVAFARNSFDRAPSAGPGGGEAVPEVVRRFDRVVLVTGAALVPLMGLSAVALFLTPLASNDVWPLYTFFVVGLICVLVWSYLFARFFVRLAAGDWGRR